LSFLAYATRNSNGGGKATSNRS